MLSQKEIGSELIRDKATVALARLFYGFGRYRLSQIFYEKITDDSPMWMTSVFESSWAYYMANKFNKVLGKLEVINSPFFDDKFEPEFFVLRLVVLLKMCRVLELKPFIVKFNKSYTPMVKPIAKYASKYRHNHKVIYETIGNFFLGRKKYYGLPARLVSHVAMEESIYRTYYAIYSILDEREEIDRHIRTANVPVFYKKVSARINDYVKEMQAKVAKLIIGRIKHYYEHLGEQIDRSRLVRLEYMDAEKTFMERAMVVYDAKSPTHKEVKAKYVSVPGDYIYWPFVGEYWLDELGYHEFSMENACREE